MTTTRRLCFFLILAVALTSCFREKELRVYKNDVGQLETLLSPANFKGTKPGSRINVKDRFGSNLAYLKLLNDEIVNAGSQIIFTDSSCISMITRKRSSGDQFTDHVVFHNLNEGRFMCNVNDLYTLNQDERVGHLEIYTAPITALMTVSFVRN